MPSRLDIGLESVEAWVDVPPNEAASRARTVKNLITASAGLKSVNRTPLQVYSPLKPKPPKPAPPPPIPLRRIKLVTEGGTTVRSFKHVRDASDRLDVPISTIYNRLSSRGMNKDGLYWRYE